jgi:hypothetical protein
MRSNKLGGACVRAASRLANSQTIFAQQLATHKMAGSAKGLVWPNDRCWDQAVSSVTSRHAAVGSKISTPTGVGHGSCRS